MIDKRGRAHQEFRAFLADFVRGLNNRSEEGWALLVEGPRDKNALRKLGYRGSLATVSDFARSGARVFGGSVGVVIFTDLDREGALLAAKFVRRLQHERVRVSLRERRELKAESKGVFLHVENLGRFSNPEAGEWEEVRDMGRAPRPARPYREGLRRFKRSTAGSLSE